VDILRELKDRNISTVVTIGNDTTLILGTILSRFNVKIIGIVDKDIENYKIVEDLRITEGSRILLLKNCECHYVEKLLMDLKGKKLSYEDTLKYIIDLLERCKVDYEIKNKN